eukprot:gene15451-17034_t
MKFEFEFARMLLPIILLASNYFYNFNFANSANCDLKKCNVVVYKDCKDEVSCGSIGNKSCGYLATGLAANPKCAWNQCKAVIGNGKWQDICAGINAFDIKGPCNAQLAKGYKGLSPFTKIFSPGFHGIWKTYEGATHLGDNSLSLKLTCSIGGDSLICKDTSMRYVFDENLKFENESLVTLRDPQCHARIFYPQVGYSLDTPYGKCGTTVKETNSHIIYTNEVLFPYFAKAGQVLRTSGKRIKFSCSLPRFAESNTAQIQSSLAMINASESGYGAFVISLSMFESAKFKEQIQNFPASVQLDSRLYFESRVNLEDAGIVLLLEECSASPTTDKNHPSRYHLIKKRCPVDSTLQFNRGAKANVHRFSFKSFTFSPRNGQLYLHCKVFMCHRRSTDPRCTTGCSGNNINRIMARRSVEDATQFETVTGPNIWLAVAGNNYIKSLQKRDIHKEYLPSKEYSLTIGPFVPGSKRKTPHGFSTIKGISVGLGLLAFLLIGCILVVICRRRQRQNSVKTNAENVAAGTVDINMAYEPDLSLEIDAQTIQ